MLLLFGITTRTKTLGAGTFYCRNEGGERIYLLLEARRWFTLFFIPLIPLKVLGKLVQCSSCGVRYDPAVLPHAATAPTEQVTADEVEAIVRIGTNLGMSPEKMRRILVESVSPEVVDEAIRRPSPDGS